MAFAALSQPSHAAGQFGDFAGDQISGMLFTLGWNETPRSAQALGWHLPLEGGPQHAGPARGAIRLSRHPGACPRLGLGTETPELARFMGPKGILDASTEELRHSPQLGVDTAPSYWDDVWPHLWNYFQAVKSRKPVVSCFRKKPVYWDAGSRSIRD